MTTSGVTPRAMALFREITRRAAEQMPLDTLRTCIREAAQHVALFDGGMALETDETRAWSDAERGFRSAVHAIAQRATEAELLLVVDELERAS